MANGVDTSMYPMQMPFRDAPLDPAVIDADLRELSAADHSVLASGEVAHSPIGVCAENLALRAHFLRHTPRVTGGVLRRGDLCDG
jgi:hypothetical protein